MVIPFRQQGGLRPRAVAIGWLMTATGAVAVAAPQVASASAVQPQIERAADLAEAVRARFDVTTLSDGVRLFPLSPVEGVGVVELSDGVVAVDGQAVSGQELREVLGEDADLLLRLSYLGAAEQAALFREPDATTGTGAGAPSQPEPEPEPAPELELVSEPAPAPPADRKSVV